MIPGTIPDVIDLMLGLGYARSGIDGTGNGLPAGSIDNHMIEEVYISDLPEGALRYFMSLDPKDAGVAMGRYLIDNPRCVDEIRAKMEKRGARL